MKSAVICLETQQIFRGISDGMKHIENSKVGNEDHLPRTLVIFEGRYIIENTIEITKDNVILFGVEGSNQPDSYVYISRGRYEAKGEYMFKLGPSVKKLYLHNIRFNPKEKILKIEKGRNVAIHANLCVMGQVDNEGQNSDENGLIETNHSWSLDLESDK